MPGMEYKVLELLGQRIGTPLTRERISEALYDGISEPKPNSIDVFVGRLRKKLAQATFGDIYIKTVRGQGFMLSTSAERTLPATF